MDVTNSVSWVAVPLRVVEIYRRFGGTCCLCPQNELRTLSLSETSVGFYQNALRHLAEARFLRGHCREEVSSDFVKSFPFNPLNAELNPICHLVALLGAHHILYVSRVRVNSVYWAFSWAFKMAVGPLHLNQIKLCAE